MSYNSDELKNNLKQNIVQRFSMKYEDSELLNELRMILDFALYDYHLSPAKNEVIIRSIQNDDEIIKMFLISKKIEGCSDRSIRNYGYLLRKELYRYSQKSCLEWSSEDVKYYLAKKMIENPNLTKSYLDTIRRYFNTFFVWLTENDYIEKNPMRNTKRIKIKKTIRSTLTDEDIVKMRRALQDEINNCKQGIRSGNKRTFKDSVGTAKRNLAVFEFMVSTGCRVTELCESKLSDLKLESGEIKVLGKGNKERVCYINSIAKLSLLDYLNDDYVKQVREETGSDYVFISLRSNGTYKKGLHVAPSQVGAMVRELGRNLGIEHVHPHKFRRTTATNLLRKGMRIEEVQKVLGHDDISTTTIYAQVSNDDVKINHKKFMG